MIATGSRIRHSCSGPKILDVDMSGFENKGCFRYGKNGERRGLNII
jgi:hypothetical protein